jgi:hypothetical protein
MIGDFVNNCSFSSCLLLNTTYTGRPVMTYQTARCQKPQDHSMNPSRRKNLELSNSLFSLSHRVINRTSWLCCYGNHLRYTGSPSDGPAPRPEVVTLIACSSDHQPRGRVYAKLSLRTTWMLMGAWGVGVGLKFFLISALNEGDWSASRHVRLNPGEIAYCTNCIGGFGGPRGRSGRVQNPQE